MLALVVNTLAEEGIKSKRSVNEEDSDWRPISSEQASIHEIYPYTSRSYSNEQVEYQNPSTESSLPLTAPDVIPYEQTETAYNPGSVGNVSAIVLECSNAHLLNLFSEIRRPIHNPTLSKELSIKPFE